jgi:hypothetical protein
MATPLVRTPQIQGGTMYAFASGTRDLTRAFQNPDIKFEFSKYALLDIPNFEEPVNGKNTVDFDQMLDYSNVAYSPVGNAGHDFAITFQNYALNLEEELLQDDDFDSTLYGSDAEKIFFKWLHKLGAMRFKTADSTETTQSGLATEELNATGTGTDYDRVVKYLGSIDVGNDIQYKGNAYHEVYINVPSSIGYTPTVLFNSKTYNTTANKIYPEATISGRNGQTHPDVNMNLETLVDTVDTSDPQNLIPYYDIDVNSTPNFGIDWTAGDYHGIATNSDLNTLQDYAKQGGDFRFNAILVYYDLYSESVPANRETNLYGILILDNPQDNPGAANSSYIPELIKYKPNEITGLNGNAFGLKLNIKFNSSLDNVGVEVNINDFTTFSMDLFMDTTSALENAAKLLSDANARYSRIKSRVDDLENLVMSMDSSTELLSRITQLETEFQNTSVNLADSNSLLQLITNANQRINQLIDGTIPSEVQYNVDVLFNGPGIIVDKTVPNKIKIKNDLKTYVFGKPFLWNESTLTVYNEITSANQYNPANATGFGIWTRLKEFSNQLRLAGKTTTQAADNNINIYIDDKLIKWQDGQSYKIVFENLDLNGNNINVYTNWKDGFNKLIGSVSAAITGNNPYFEIVCTNSATFEFEIDIIR